MHGLTLTLDLNMCLNQVFVMSDQDTRHRILHAAAQLFVEEGFQKTSVRSICKAADANVAAVNYHFSDKRGLYHAVIQYAMEQKIEAEDQPDADLETRLRIWISSLVHSTIGQEPELLCQVMANEMIRPTEFLPIMLQEMIGPRLCLLESIIAEALGVEPDDKRVQRLAMSVAGQVLLYDHCRPAVTLLMPEMDYSDACLEGLIDHVTRASVGMISSFRESPNDK